jgi:hypothetical protein
VGWVIHRSEITSDDWQITYDATERRTGCLHMHITRERGTGRDGDLGAGAGCTRQYGGRTQGRGAKWNTFLSVDSGRSHNGWNGRQTRNNGAEVWERQITNTGCAMTMNGGRHKDGRRVGKTPQGLSQRTKSALKTGHLAIFSGREKEAGSRLIRAPTLQLTDIESENSPETAVRRAAAEDTQSSLQSRWMQTACWRT